MPLNSDILTVCDAVVEELNSSDASFTQSFTAERKYLAEVELSGLSGIKCYVVPLATMQQIRSRSTTRRLVKIQIAILSKVADLTNNTIDPLMELVQEIREFLRFRVLSSTPDFGWRNDQNEPVYNPQHLHELRQFTSVITVEFVNTDAT